MTLEDKLLENINTRRTFKEKIDNLLLRKFNFGQRKQERLFKYSPFQVGNVGLTEGAIVDYPDEYGIRLYIAKGTLAKAVNNMKSNDMYEVNLGHNSSSPLDVIGMFKKEDVHLVDLGDGRQGLSVDFHFDEESITYKELKRLNQNLSLSAEFYVNEYTLLELSVDDQKEIGLDAEYPIIIRAVTDITLDAFAVVKNPADINAFQNYKLNKLMAEEIKETIITEETVVETPAEAVEIPATEEVKDGVVEETSAEIVEETKENEVLSVVKEVKTQLETLGTQNKELLERLNAETNAKQQALEELKVVKTQLSELLGKAEPIVREELKERKEDISQKYLEKARY